MPSLPVLALLVILPLLLMGAASFFVRRFCCNSLPHLWAAENAARAHPPSDSRQSGVLSACPRWVPSEFTPGFFKAHDVIVGSVAKIDIPDLAHKLMICEINRM